MSFENLTYECAENGVLTIRFNRPDKLNAMTEAMGDDLIAAVEKARAEPGARVVVLSGEGKAFCAGGDMTMIKNNTKRTVLENTDGMKAFYERFLRIRDIPVPTIASIQGAAIGAGLCIAMACDIRLATENAKLAVNFTALGLHPGMGATWLLPRVVGMPHASELLFSSRRINGAEAQRIGLVNRAVPEGELDAATKALAEEIAACAPVAVRLTKKALRQSQESTLTDQLNFEAIQQAVTFSGKDVLEGTDAVMAKRKPVFTGE
ncbi:MAG: enoyl-CoA hydratase/isomerase family protein [Chrysiogenetes bacterium]|nr:enoyl-CoA hydratase/isomerase family protein [Chrysiogenetes bacterium]